MSLFRRQIGADRRRIVNCEYAVDLRIGRQQGGHDLQSAFAAAFGVLIIREHFDIRVAPELGLAALHAVLYRRNRRPVDDHHVAFTFQTVGYVLTGHLPRLGVIRGDGGIGPFRRHVNRHDHDPRLFGAFYRRADPFRIRGVEDDHVHFRGNEVIDLRYLLAQIVPAGDQRHLDVISRQLARFQLGTFGDLHEERVSQVAHRHADGLQIFCLRKRGCGQQRASTERGH